MNGSPRNVDQNSSGERELLLKILVIGDYGVGKTAIVRRYTEGLFSSCYKITIGADFSVKTIQWDDKTKVNLQLWDIAGHERFGCMTRIYYKYAVGAALVFDISRMSTFQSMSKWLEDLREKVELQDGLPVPVVLLANKCDITPSAVTQDAISKFCKNNNIAAWFLTSAKEGISVDDAMNALIGKVVDLKAQSSSHPDAVILKDQNGSTTGCCKS